MYEPLGHYSKGQILYNSLIWGIQDSQIQRSRKWDGDWQTGGGGGKWEVAVQWV